MKKVLIISNDTKIHMLFQKKMAESLDLKFAPLTNLAFKQAKIDDIDILILDISRNQDLAVTLYKRFKTDSIHPELPVMIISESNQHECIEKFEALGFDHHMYKPVNTHELKQILLHSDTNPQTTEPTPAQKKNQKKGLPVNQIPFCEEAAAFNNDLENIDKTLHAINEYVTIRQLELGLKHPPPDFDLDDDENDENNERRKQYRNLTRNKKNIRVYLEDKGGIKFLTQLQNICAEGIGIRMPIDANVDVNDNVKMYFHFLSSDQKLSSSAIIKFNLIRGNYKFAGILLKDADKFLNTLDPSLLKLFNERKCCRVTTKFETDITLNHNIVYRGKLFDISSNGLALLLAPSIDETFNKKIVRISFLLPSSQEIANVWCQGRHSKKAGKFTRHGFIILNKEQMIKYLTVSKSTS